MSRDKNVVDLNRVRFERFIKEVDAMPHCPTCGWVICDCCDECGLPTQYTRDRHGETCDCWEPVPEDPA